MTIMVVKSKICSHFHSQTWRDIQKTSRTLHITPSGYPPDILEAFPLNIYSILPFTLHAYTKWGYSPKGTTCSSWHLGPEVISRLITYNATYGGYKPIYPFIRPSIGVVTSCRGPPGNHAVFKWSLWIFLQFGMKIGLLPFKICDQLELGPFWSRPFFCGKQTHLKTNNVVRNLNLFRLEHVILRWTSD